MEEIPSEIKIEKLSVLQQALADYHEDLGFVIRNSTPQAVLTITANGNPYLFKNVELLVKFAPIVPRWKIIPFIQPECDLQIFKEAIDIPFKFHGVYMKVSDCYFKIVMSNSFSHSQGIRVYLKNFIVYKDHPKFREAVDTVIEHLVGEKAFANEIAFIDMAQLKSDDMDTVLPLYQLYANLCPAEVK